MGNNSNNNLLQNTRYRKTVNNDRAKYKEIDDILKIKQCTDCGQCNQFDGVCVYDDAIFERGNNE